MAAPRMQAGFVAGAALYALGQGCALLFQWLLLQRFGLQGYGEVGLAHLGLVTVLFLADLGYASLFLREDPTAAAWERDWRLALRHRLIATLVLDALLVGVTWWQTGSHSESFRYLLAALPATLFGLINYSAPLLAQGRRIPGFLVQQIAMPMAILSWLTMPQQSDGAGSWRAGAVVSGGFLVQAIVNLATFGGPPRLLCPQPGKGDSRLLGSALRLSLMSLVGILHDRLTPLLLASVAPAFLPVYLFLSYLMSGASGIFSQFNRLLLAEAHSDLGKRWALGLMSLVLGVSALGAQILPLASEHWASAIQRAWLPWITPVLASTTVTLLSGILSTLLIGWHREHVLLRVLLWGLSCSAVAQLAAAASPTPQAILWARLLCLMAVAAVSLHLCGMRLNRGGHAALASAALASFTWLGQFGCVLAAGLLLPVAGEALRSRSLFSHSWTMTSTAGRE